ncbi:MAG TPA: hypothetical protein VF196_04120 [Casimicrobiaceae bacterium]
MRMILVALLALASVVAHAATTDAPAPAQPAAAPVQAAPANPSPPSGPTTSRRRPTIKPPPAVPPEKAARPLASIPMVNPGFESTRPGKVGAPEGWWAIQHAGPDSYVFEHDSKVKHSGERSMRVTNIGPEPFGSIYQTIPAIAYRGKTLRFSAWIRTEGTVGNRFGTGAGLKLHAVRGGYPLEVAEMRNDAVHGSVEWTRYEIALRIPDEAEAVEVGMLVFGPGIAWLDDTALDVIPDLPPKPATAPPGTAGAKAP